MSDKIRNCNLCKKEIEIITEIEGGKENRHCRTFSREGALFGNRWYCSKCWGECCKMAGIGEYKK